jgi:hypothetical protein
MIELGSVRFRLSAPEMPREELRVYSTRLFDEWDESLGFGFLLDDYSLRLEIEEGSVVGVAVVTATLSALYKGVCEYPKFVEGLQKIQSHVRLASDHLVQRAQEPFTRLNLQTKVVRKNGVPGQLQRLFERVRSRVLSVDEAMREAERILGQDAGTAPDFMRALAQNLANVQRDPVQLALPIEFPDDLQVELDKADVPRSRIPKKNPLPSTHLKIEVWRDSRTGKRHVRISEV